jgi:hypothetical protein
MRRRVEASGTSSISDLTRIVEPNRLNAVGTGVAAGSSKNLRVKKPSRSRPGLEELSTTLKSAPGSCAFPRGFAADSESKFTAILSRAAFGPSRSSMMTLSLRGPSG